MADENLEQQPTEQPPEDLSLDLDLEQPAPEVAEPPEQESPALRAARERAEAAERRAEEAERRAREAATVVIPPQPSRDPEYDAEEKQLADYRAQGATEEQMSWLKFRIDTQRQAREAKRDSREAKFFAADAADRAAFGRIEAEEPRRFRHFAPKVEEIVEQFRRQGQLPPAREIIYDNLVGKAVRQGTLKVGAAKPTAPAPAPSVPRGRMPPARSDVNPRDKSGMTEHEKRIERMKAEFAKGHTL